MKKRKIFLITVLTVSLSLALFLLGYCILFKTDFFPALMADTAATEASEAVTPSPELALKPEPIPTPTPTPTPTPEPEFEEYDISLMALGDNLLHMGIVNTGRMEDGTYNYDFLFQGMEPFLEKAEIKCINQETIFGGNELGFSGYPHFNSPTEVGDAIAKAGFNVVLHATNHTVDQGLEGLLNCVSFWEKYPHVLVAGMQGDPPSDEIPLLEIEGITFAILNYTYGPNLASFPASYEGHLNLLCAYDENSRLIDFTSLNPKVTEDIKKAKELADIVIVFPHWGTEYQDKPSTYQEKFALEMTEAGADLIIGTHPHVPQPVEWITSENGNTALCYYSLGNYVSTQKQTLCMLEGMAWVTFHVTEDDVFISEKATGVLPLICHYKSGPVRLEQVYFLEDYTEEHAARHGIRNYGEVTLYLDDMLTRSAHIFADFVIKKSDVLGTSDQ